MVGEAGLLCELLLSIDRNGNFSGEPYQSNTLHSMECGMDLGFALPHLFHYPILLCLVLEKAAVAVIRLIHDSPACVFIENGHRPDTPVQYEAQ